MEAPHFLFLVCEIQGNLAVLQKKFLEGFDTGTTCSVHTNQLGKMPDSTEEELSAP